MSKWLDGLILAEQTLEESNVPFTELYFDTCVWDDGFDDFERGYQDYLDNYKFRMKENEDVKSI